MRIAKSNNHLQAMFVPKNPFVREIQKMFLDAESSDVVFEVGSSSSDDDSSSSSGLATTFNAHKLILQRCAPTLYEICGDGEDTVPIQNVKPDCFHYMRKPRSSDVVCLARKFNDFCSVVLLRTQGPLRSYENERERHY